MPSLLFLTVLVVGASWLVVHGSTLLTQELSKYSQQSYGVLGEQLESDASCADQASCSGLESVGQDLQEINSTFQQVLGTSDEN